MRLSDVVKTSALVLLGYGSTGCGSRSQDFSEYHLQKPTISDLVTAIAINEPQADIIKIAKEGKTFYNGVGLFIYNYTLHYSRHLADNFGNKEADPTLTLSGLHNYIENTKRDAILEDDKHTMGMVKAAEDLKGILNYATLRGNFNETCRVIGYLDRASVENSCFFLGFDNLLNYAANPNVKDNPVVVLSVQYNQETRNRLQELHKKAQEYFNKIPSDVKNKIVRWLGRYGYDALSKMQSISNADPLMVWDFQYSESRPLRLEDLVEIPEPLVRNNQFYDRFGKAILEKYGLVD